MFAAVQNPRSRCCYKGNMSAAMGPPVRCLLTEAPEYLKVEFGYATATEIGDLFRALAVACIEKQVLRVLIIAGDDDAAGERALRDAATTMVLAGVSTRFRLALVAFSSRVASAYRNTQRDLNAAGVRTRMFDSEDDALGWLEVAATDSRRVRAA